MPVLDRRRRQVCSLTLLEEEAHTAGVHNSLNHGETLLVISAGDAEDVALELLTEGGAINLCGHTLLKEVAAMWAGDMGQG